MYHTRLASSLENIVLVLDSIHTGRVSVVSTPTLVTTYTHQRLLNHSSQVFLLLRIISSYYHRHLLQKRSFFQINWRYNNCYILK